MNIWYVISLSLIGLGIVFFIGCLLASIVKISRKAKTLNETRARIQEQIVPIQTSVTTLNRTLGSILSDVELKRKELHVVLESVSSIKNNVVALIKTSRAKTKHIIEKTENDPVKKAQTEAWTNTALGYLKR